MKVRHIDGMKFEIESRGHRIITDQPYPAGGDTGMTPVELMGGALAGCVAVYAADYLVRNDIPLEGLEVDIEWERAMKPARIGRYILRVKVPQELSQRQFESLSRIVKGCTVHSTLEVSPEIEIALESGA